MEQKRRNWFGPNSKSETWNSGTLVYEYINLSETN